MCCCVKICLYYYNYIVNGLNIGVTNLGSASVCHIVNSTKTIDASFDNIYKYIQPKLPNYSIETNFKNYRGFQYCLKTNFKNRFIYI